MNKLFALAIIAALMGCSDDAAQFEKKVIEDQKQYCKANPGVCERYCQDFPLEKTCPK